MYYVGVTTDVISNDNGLTYCFSSDLFSSFSQVASLGAEAIWHLTRIATVTLPLTTIAHLSTGKIMDV